jgi:hypothetical protein
MTSCAHKPHLICWFWSIFSSRSSSIEAITAREPLLSFGEVKVSMRTTAGRFLGQIAVFQGYKGSGIVEPQIAVGESRL